MGSLDDFRPYRIPPADQPLAGRTLLLVEDSRLASEAIRLLCRQSGGRLRRADSLATAERHLRGYRPDVAVVDLHLPDGSGLDLIRRLDQARPRIDVLLGLSGESGLAEAALRAGADGFLPKPVGLAAFQAMVLSRLPADCQPGARRAVPASDPPPDPTALREDLAHAAHLLAQEEPPLDYVTRFLGGVARGAGDRILANAARAAHRGEGSAVAPLLRLVRDRLGDGPAL
ncbi:response regulator [Rubellimicrobium arenae]|uniref:response regulator n=1 Tax=Rubellimicrobium arenae TaxID=2817372 RepID=UPI001B315225|nr:response regulator [Rubellimicrobium arenae]